MNNMVKDLMKKVDSMKIRWDKDDTKKKKKNQKAMVEIKSI